MLLIDYERLLIISVDMALVRDLKLTHKYICLTIWQNIWNDRVHKTNILLLSE